MISLPSPNFTRIPVSTGRASSRETARPTADRVSSNASALTVLYAWTVLRERPARAVLAGAALVCAGVVILAL